MNVAFFSFFLPFSIPFCVGLFLHPPTTRLPLPPYPHRIFFHPQGCCCLSLYFLSSRFLCSLVVHTNITTTEGDILIIARGPACGRTTFLHPFFPPSFLFTRKFRGVIVNIFLPDGTETLRVQDRCPSGIPSSFPLSISHCTEVRALLLFKGEFSRRRLPKRKDPENVINLGSVFFFPPPPGFFSVFQRVLCSAAKVSSAAPADKRDERSPGLGEG